MSDKPVCIGIYDGDGRVQLAPPVLYVSMKGRGGVKGVTARYGDEHADPIRAATDQERQIDAVMVRGLDLIRALDAPRLRLRILTVLNDVVDQDLDMDGAKPASDFIKMDAKCRR